MTLNCVIIDDEPLAADMLTEYAKKTPMLNLIGTYNSAIEAMKTLRENPVDLVFLDVQMPELSGIEFARILPKKTKVIFTTAFKEYAADGYKVNAADYLLKPISYETFLESVTRLYNNLLDATKTQLNEQGFIFIKSEYKLVKIALKDILYINGLKDYVKIFLTDGRNVTSLMNMKKLEEALPYPEFMRVHRSYIVHMPKVEMIDRFRFVFGKEFIPISESYKNAVQQFIDDHTIS